MQHVQQLLTTVDVELRVNVLRVRAHGVLADDQARGDGGHCFDVRSRMTPASSDAEGRFRRRFAAGFAAFCCRGSSGAPTARNSMGSAVTVPFAASDLNSVPVAASSVRPST